MTDLPDTDGFFDETSENVSDASSSDTEYGSLDDEINDSEEEKEEGEPSSELIERRILAFILNYPVYFEDYIAKIYSKDFQNRYNRSLFSSIRKSVDSKEPLDDLTLSDYFSHIADISPNDALSHITSVRGSLTKEDNSNRKEIVPIFEAIYARFKRYVAKRETVGKASSILTDKKHRTPQEEVAYLEEMAETFSKMAKSILPEKKNRAHISSELESVMQKIKDNIDKDSTIVGVDTGFDYLNEATTGFGSEDLILIGGRPSMGKTALSLQMMINMARRGVQILFFSLEMPQSDIIMRMIASMAKVGLTELKKGKLSDSEWKRVAIACKEQRELPIDVDDSSGVNISYIESISKDWHEEKVLGNMNEEGEVPKSAIFVDYIQLVNATKDYKTSTESVSEVSKRSKQLARRLKSSLIALTQLNRSLEQRPNKRPINSDLRESGQLEQDADIIMFVYRDEVYNVDTSEKGVLELILGKQRNGGLGTLKTKFEKRCQYIEDIEFIAT